MYWIDDHGFSTIECLVALLVLSVGLLGAAGTMALAWRAEAAGERAGLAAGLAGWVLDSLQAHTLSDQGRCDGLRSGSATGDRGTRANWAATPSRGGREIRLTLVYRSLVATATDSGWEFIPCH